MENISPDDQQERNDPILLPVSEDPKTATRFSDPILHRAENHFDLSNVRRNSKPDKILNDRTRKSPSQASVDRNTTLLSSDCRKAVKKA